jgi:adenine-specific DNA-methyltransferase
MTMNFVLQRTKPTSYKFTKREYPQVIKYMGSKARILDFVLEGINDAYQGGPICDLFAGACSLSGAIGDQSKIITNDIQNYSKTIACAYLHSLSDGAKSLDIDVVCATVERGVKIKLQKLKSDLGYNNIKTLDEFSKREELNKRLIDLEFGGEYHLFLKNYSGTWWSAEQCAWIDGLREGCDQLLQAGSINSGDHSVLLTCVMHAMAYCGQGTGHYAQYRDAKTESSMTDIMLYRQKSIPAYFKRKYLAVRDWNVRSVTPNIDHEFLALDFEACLERVSEATIYADPPYAFVHYSRFYHAIETFTLYDYPKLQEKGGKVVKGRYRDNRHQSPFSIRSQVPSAFEKMFAGAKNSRSNLVLSYSNTALLDLPQIMEIANDTFGPQYSVEVVTTDHQHMTMGRRADRLRDVEEALLVAKNNFLS